MKRNGAKYLVASKHGHIKGTFSRGQLHYREQYTPQLLQINTEVLKVLRSFFAKSIYTGSLWIYM